MVHLMVLPRTSLQQQLHLPTTGFFNSGFDLLRIVVDWWYRKLPTSVQSEKSIYAGGEEDIQKRLGKTVENDSRILSSNWTQSRSVERWKERCGG